MKKFLLPLLAAVLFLPACAENPISGNPIGAPLTNQGVTLDNGCVVDAVECCKELEGSGAEAEIFLARYTVNGQAFGHAMTRFYWPPRFGSDGKQRQNAYSIAYVYDRKNASTPINPNKVDASNATSLAKHMLPGVTWAAWADQAPFQSR